MYENFVGTWETVRNREVSVLERCPHGEVRLYMKAFDDDTIPDAETLSLTYLTDRVHWPTMTADPAKPNQYLPTAREK